jgi:sugar phosphate isomerase/epimerase
MRTALVSAAGMAVGQGFARLARAAEATGPATTAQAGPARAGGGPLFSFYAMDTGLRGPDVPTIEARVALLKKLGYTGIDVTFNVAQLPQYLEQLDKSGLELWATYLLLFLEDGLPADLEAGIKLLKGRRTRIELALRSKQIKPSDPAGDAKGAEMVRRTSDMAADTGPLVSVYPHRGFWTERVEDGLRLAAQVGRKNVGANFNLVHWKWVPQTRPLEALLADALPHLMTVTINGLAGDQIVPLDEGDYDVAGFMALVKKVGYRGPVGFQGYGIKGPSEGILKHTMDKWREIMGKIGG